MPLSIIVGAQWGDEGKGRVVELLSARADYVARFNGGDNAGHTVTVGGQTFVNTSAEVTDLVIPVGSKDPARATSDVWFACNLDKRTPEIPVGASPQAIQEGTWQTSFDVFDSFGRAHKLQVNFSRVPGVANRWRAETVVDPAAQVATNTRAEVGAANNQDNVFFVDFDNLGALAAVRDAQGDLLNAGNLQVQVSFDVPETTVPAGQEAAYRLAVRAFPLPLVARNLSGTSSCTAATTNASAASPKRAG